MSESQNTLQILLISAAIIASTRVTSYISEDLSKDLAKILPFTILAAFILGSSFFNVEGVMTKISQIPSLFDNIITFVVFIFIIEFVFRLLFSVFQFVKSKDEDNEEL